MVQICQAETSHFPFIYTFICEGSMKYATGIISFLSLLRMLCNLLEIEIISNHFFLFSCQATVLSLELSFQVLPTYFLVFLNENLPTKFKIFKQFISRWHKKKGGGALSKQNFFFAQFRHLSFPRDM